MLEDKYQIALDFIRKVMNSGCNIYNPEFCLSCEAFDILTELKESMT